MVQPNKFRFTLINSDNSVLPNSPDGWMKTSIKYNRSQKYGGLFRAIANVGNFVRDSATYLRSAYYTQGITSRRYIKIEKLIPLTWAYRQLFYGRVDFTRFKDTLTGVDVSAIEKTISVLIDAYEDVKYALPLTGDDVLTITLNPLILDETADFIFRPSSDFRSDAYFAIEIVTNNQLATQASVKNAGFYADNHPVFNADNTNNFYQAITDTNVRINGHVEGIVSSLLDGDKHYQINFYNSSGTLVKTIYDITTTVATFSVDFDFTTDLLQGQKLFLFFEHIGSTNTDTGFQINSGTMSLAYKTKSPATTCKALPASAVYKRLIAKINQGETSVITQSVLLDTELKQLVYTCSNSILATQIGNIYQAGDTLQQGGAYIVIAEEVGYFLPNGTSHIFSVGETFTAVLGKDTFTSPLGGFVRLISVIPQVIISFTDFFKDIYGIKGGQACFGIDNYKACLEDLSFAYRNSTTLDFGSDISDWNLSPNLERIYSSIKAGYIDQQYDAINGSQEVMSEQIYSIPQTLIKKELDITLSSRADPYGVEQIRAIPANVYRNTAASKSDNDVHIFWLTTDLSTPLTVQEGCSMWSGVDGSYYNWFISPKQNILRGGRFLASCLDGMEGAKISFENAIKNGNMVTIDLSGRRVAEGDDIPISDLGTKLFKPHLFTFTCAQDNDAGIAIQNSPYGLFKANWQGVYFSGYANEVETDEGSNSSQTFKLECGANVDLTTFIR